MKKEDLSALSAIELRNKLNDTREEIMKLRFQLASGELTDNSRFRHSRRMIARYLTAINKLNVETVKGK
ncbi:MAG: 50S ribosomal protein L29 [Chloroflexota bacterium]|jgi:large subunit ribosomal protein L29